MFEVGSWKSKLFVETFDIHQRYFNGADETGKKKVESNIKTIPEWNIVDSFLARNNYNRLVSMFCSLYVDKFRLRLYTIYVFYYTSLE